MRKICLTVMVLCLSASLAYGADQKKSTDKYPFFPSMISTESGKPARPDDFEEPIICSGCHMEIYEQWKGSMHSSAFVDPDQRLSVAWVCNGMPGEVKHQLRAREINTLIYEDLGLNT